MIVVVALFLGVNIEDMGLGNVGWGIMVGWTIWIVILPVFLEIIDQRFQKGSFDFL